MSADTGTRVRRREGLSVFLGSLFEYEDGVIVYQVDPTGLEEALNDPRSSPQLVRYGSTDEAFMDGWWPSPE